ncbi:MAG: biopolymer transporter ExbD [Nitrococcus sp.]|nr:biopolymer transporter ExbD [Nitrococcus sp.]
MAFGSFNGQGGHGSTPMAEINVIPLVDIMLVLLVIFIVTAPLLTNAVKIDLPKVASRPNEVEAKNVRVAIDAAGRFYWNGEPVNRATLSKRLIAAGQRSPAPELHLRADHSTDYGILVEIMAEAGKAGLGRIGFISDPLQAKRSPSPPKVPRQAR